MIRAGRLFITFAFILAGTAAGAAPVRLARTPDFHAGKIAFSYLGDIWVVDEDGSNPRRLTDNVARDINPRFSPDGKWIAFSSAALRELRRVRHSRGRRDGPPAHLPQRQRRGGRLDPRLEAGRLPGVSRRRRLPQRGDALPGAGGGRS